MLTFTTFALLALALTLLVWVACLLKHANEQEQFINFLISTRVEKDDEIEILKNMHESELTRADTLADKLSTLNAQYEQVEAELKHLWALESEMQTKVFETKEEYVPWIEQLQQEINDLDDQVRTLDNKSYIDLAEIEDLKFKLEATQIDLDVANACIWDKEKHISEKQEILNEVAAELFSLGFRDGIIKDVEVLRIRDLALEQNIPF